jgi:hypothetical protein
VASGAEHRGVSILSERSVQTPWSINATGSVGGTYQLHFAPRHQVLVRAGPPGTPSWLGSVRPAMSSYAYIGSANSTAAQNLMFKAPGDGGSGLILGQAPSYSIGTAQPVVEAAAVNAAAVHFLREGSSQTQDIVRVIDLSSLTVLGAFGPAGLIRGPVALPLRVRLRTATRSVGSTSTPRSKRLSGGTAQHG